MAHVGGQVFGRKRSTFLLGEDDPEILLSRKKVQNGVTQGGVTGNAGRAGSSWLIAAAFMGQLLDSIK
jgi:FMN-dependent NADH-azoreductase